jgi:predicted DNA-binding protein (MmcQ/YjbR family)
MTVARHPAKVVKRVTDLSVALPDAVATQSHWGDPSFQVNGKTFATVERYRDRLCLVVKVPKNDLDAVLADERFFLAPYVGRYGWVCFVIEGTVDWGEVDELLRESYRLIAPARLRARLDDGDATEATRARSGATRAARPKRKAAR